MNARDTLAVPLERFIVALGACLRVYLALVNRQANDDHMRVVRIIAEQHRPARLHEAWEGFQPQLYHATVAMIWRSSPWPSAPAAALVLAQLLSCAAGILTVFVVWRALTRRGVVPPVRLLALALVSLNPALVALNAQATNDSFVILFSTLGLYAGWIFFRTGERRAFLGMTACATLAVLSKGNGLVLWLALVATFAGALLRPALAPESSRPRLARLGLVFVGVSLTLITALGSYRANWVDAGSPLAINMPRQPPPRLFEKTYVQRPGVTSIVDSYLTFRLADMLAYPADTNGVSPYPLHRTSLWSQLYGRAHVAHFAQFPPSWQSTGPLVFTIARLILIVALVPSACLLVGLVRAGRAAFGTFGARGRFGADPLAEGLVTVTGFGFIAFIVSYTFVYRDFSTMKAEFLFPGLLAYALFFADGASFLAARLGRLARRVAAVLSGLVLTLYVAEVAVLAGQLTYLRLMRRPLQF